MTEDNYKKHADFSCPFTACSFLLVSSRCSTQADQPELDKEKRPSISTVRVDPAFPTSEGSISLLPQSRRMKGKRVAAARFTFRKRGWGRMAAMIVILLASETWSISRCDGAVIKIGEESTTAEKKKCLGCLARGCVLESDTSFLCIALNDSHVGSTHSTVYNHHNVLVGTLETDTVVMVSCAVTAVMPWGKLFNTSLARCGNATCLPKSYLRFSITIPLTETAYLSGRTRNITGSSLSSQGFSN